MLSVSGEEVLGQKGHWAMQYSAFLALAFYDAPAVAVLFWAALDPVEWNVRDALNDWAPMEMSRLPHDYS